MAFERAWVGIKSANLGSRGSICFEIGAKVFIEPTIIPFRTDENQNKFFELKKKSYMIVVLEVSFLLVYLNTYQVFFRKLKNRCIFYINSVCSNASRIFFPKVVLRLSFYVTISDILINSK